MKAINTKAERETGESDKQYIARLEKIISLAASCIVDGSDDHRAVYYYMKGLFWVGVPFKKQEKESISKNNIPYQIFYEASIFKGLSIRAQKIIRRASREYNAHTFGDVAKLGKDKLLVLKNCGPTTVNDIEKWLLSHGIKLED